MMAGVGARFLVARRITDNCHVTRRRAHDFAHATSSIANDDDCSGGRRFTVVVAVLQKRHNIRFGHSAAGGADCRGADDTTHPKRAPKYMSNVVLWFSAILDWRTLQDWCATTLQLPDYVHYTIDWTLQIRIHFWCYPRRFDFNHIRKVIVQPLCADGDSLSHLNQCTYSRSDASPSSVVFVAHSTKSQFVSSMINNNNILNTLFVVLSTFRVVCSIII